MAETISAITPQELDNLIKGGKTLDVIDVRMPTEFRECHTDLARNVPLDSLDPKTLMEERNGGPLYILCRSGNRSRMACEKIVSAGYGNVVNVEGGMEAWEKAGLPVVRGKKVMALERQVRIAAGFFVLAGAVLGWFVHPGFIAIPAFVGAGLMFAGITNTCGMGWVLMKMPWNQ